MIIVLLKVLLHDKQTCFHSIPSEVTYVSFLTFVLFLGLKYSSLERISKIGSKNIGCLSAIDAEKPCYTLLRAQAGHPNCSRLRDVTCCDLNIYMCFETAAVLPPDNTDHFLGWLSLLLLILSS